MLRPPSSSSCLPKARPSCRSHPYRRSPAQMVAADIQLADSSLMALASNGTLLLDSQACARAELIRNTHQTLSAVTAIGLAVCPNCCSND